MAVFPPFTTPTSPLPAEGDFLLPVCIDAETLAFLLSVISFNRRNDAENFMRARNAILEAMAFVNNPAGAACNGEIEVNGMKLRQSPENFCILQQEQGSENWVDVFDYSLCVPESAADEITINQWIQEGSTLLSVLVELYDGTAESIDEDIEYGQGNDTNLDKALCSALALMVNAFFDAELERRRRNLTIARLAGLTLTLVSVVAGLFTAGTAWIVKGFALGGVSTTLASILGDMDLAALEDQEAREELICCLYGELSGATPQRSLFIAAAAHCTSLTGNAGELANFIYAASTDLELYVGFIHYMARLSQTPEIATFLCPCEDHEDWCIDYDFHTSAYGFSTVAGQGTYVPPFTAEASPAPNRLTVYGETGTPVWFTNANITFFLGGPLALGQLVLYRGGLNGVTVAARTTWQGPTGNHQNFFTFDPPVLADTIAVRLHMSGDFGPRHTLDTMRLRGQGLPFQISGDECD
jgi:hypothetical protein